MTSTEIKLTPAMTAALKGAIIVEGGLARVSDDTKSQTVKGLDTRGLSDKSGYLTSDGVEAAFQLGNDVRPTKTAAEPLADWERELLGSGQDAETPVRAPEVAVEGTKQPAQDRLTKELVKLLDKPVPVENRADRRFARFSLRGMKARRDERARQKQIKKYGTPNTAVQAA